MPGPSRSVKTLRHERARSLAVAVVSSKSLVQGRRERAWLAVSSSPGRPGGGGGAVGQGEGGGGLDEQGDNAVDWAWKSLVCNMITSRIRWECGEHQFNAVKLHMYWKFQG